MSKENKLPARSYWEYVLPALAVITLTVSCVYISSKKFFWNDELYSYYFTSDPSFSSMLSAFHDKINNTPLLYFLLGWVWDKGFGSSELSLRLFSSLGMSLALVVTWITVRRHFGLLPTAIGVLGVFCTSNVILHQNAEARMYGLFLALCAFALLLYDKFYRGSRPSAKLLVLNACVHIAIVHTHLFGGFYSGALLLALLVTDWYFHSYKPKVYLSIVLSWISILFYIPSFLNQADAGKPRTWLPEPVIRDLLDIFNFNAGPFLNQSLLVLLLLVSGLLFFGRELRGFPKELNPDAATNSQSKTPLMVFALAYVALPLFIWLISITIKPIFWERYMIPSALGWAIMLTYAASGFISIPDLNKLASSHSGKYRKLSALFILFSALALLTFILSRPIIYARIYKSEIQPERDYATAGYNDLPIAIQYSSSFLEHMYYSPDPDKYFFILDWEAAVDEHSGLFSPQEYKHMEAIKRHYPDRFENNILTTEEFLERYDRFLVLDHPDYLRKCPLEPKGLSTARNWVDIQCPQWVEMRLLNNNAYKVTFLNNKYWYSMLLVEKVKGL